MSATEECEDTNANARLVQLVETHPCLWNPEDAYYANSVATENSWRTIAAEMELPGKVLKKRWTNIRTVFRRRFNSKTGSGITKQYYLSDALHFLVPIFQAKNEEACQEIVYEDILDGSFKNPLEEDDGETEESENIGGKNGRARAKRTRESSAIIEYFEEKRRKLKTYVKQPKPQPDSDEQFLLSLKDDMKEMDPAQKRTFKRRIFEVIEDIMGSKNAPDTPASTSQKPRVISARYKTSPGGCLVQDTS